MTYFMRDMRHSRPRERTDLAAWGTALFLAGALFATLILVGLGS